MLFGMGFNQMKQRKTHLLYNYFFVDLCSFFAFTVILIRKKHFSNDFRIWLLKNLILLKKKLRLKNVKKPLT